MLPSDEGLTRAQITTIHEAYIDAALEMANGSAPLNSEVKNDLVTIQENVTSQQTESFTTNSKKAREPQLIRYSESQLRSIGKISAILTQVGNPRLQPEADGWDTDT